MKRTLNPVINADVGKVLTLRCMICDVRVEGFYAQFENGGTCSRACMRIQDAKPKYPGHTEEDFFNRLGVHHDHPVLSRRVA